VMLQWCWSDVEVMLPGQGTHNQKKHTGGQNRFLNLFI
jgi:hypothetical protein